MNSNELFVQEKLCTNLSVFLLKATLNEIFNQINTAELEEVRKRAIKFLVAKLPGLFDSSAAPSPTNPFNKELEDIIVKNVKQARK